MLQKLRGGLVAAVNLVAMALVVVGFVLLLLFSWAMAVPYQ